MSRARHPPREGYAYYASVRDQLTARRGVSLATWARENGVTHSAARAALKAPVASLTDQQRSLRDRLARAAGTTR